MADVGEETARELAEPLSEPEEPEGERAEVMEGSGEDYLDPRVGARDDWDHAMANIRQRRAADPAARGMHVAGAEEGDSDEEEEEVDWKSRERSMRTHSRMMRRILITVCSRSSIARSALALALFACALARSVARSVARSLSLFARTRTLAVSCSRLSMKYDRT